MTTNTDGRFSGRLKTNVIDYHRPITAPLTSPRVFSRVSSPERPGSPKFPKDEVYRSILEKTKMDIDKLIENLPKVLREDNNHRKDEGWNDRKNSTHVRDRNNGNSAAGNSNLYPRSIHSKLWNPSSGLNSTPISTRREEKSVIGSHTERTSKEHCTRFVKLWRSSGQQSPSTSTSAIETDSDDCCKPSKKGPLKKFPVKRSGTGEIEASTLLSRKDIFLKHVFVVNGSVVSFKSFGYENFTNWFGDETMLSKEKRSDDFFHRELDLWWGFTSKEIKLKLYCGNKLMIEAYRPSRGKLPAKKFKETVLLPTHLSVESLVICRIRSGRLILQETRNFLTTVTNKSSTNITHDDNNNNYTNNNNNNNC